MHSKTRCLANCCETFLVARQRLMSAAPGAEDSGPRLHPSDQRDISAILKNYFLTALIRHIAANVGQAAISLVKD